MAIQDIQTGRRRRRRFAVPVVATGCLSLVANAYLLGARVSEEISNACLLIRGACYQKAKAIFAEAWIVIRVSAKTDQPGIHQEPCYRCQGSQQQGEFKSYDHKGRH